MTLYERYAALRDRFEVLAFHDATVKTFEELDEKLEPIVRERWDGKALPFPILLDATKATLKAYGISAYPTNVLIDPEGRVVKGNAEKNLEKLLAEMAAAQGLKPADESPEDPDGKGDAKTPKSDGD